MTDCLIKLLAYLTLLGLLISLDTPGDYAYSCWSDVQPPYDLPILRDFLYLVDMSDPVPRWGGRIVLSLILMDLLRWMCKLVKRLRIPYSSGPGRQYRIGPRLWTSQRSAPTLLGRLSPQFPDQMRRIPC